MFFTIFLIIVLLGFVVLFFLNQKGPDKDSGRKTINSFEECVEAGNPVMESYPRQCNADGKNFTEDIGNALEKQDLIRLSTPKPNEVVKSPLTIEGEARGNWFFEASFPVKIVDANGVVLGQVPAATSEDWMTEDFVPFSATLTFEEPTTETGKLILEKDNPSDLPENSDSLEIPLKFR